MINFDDSYDVLMYMYFSFSVIMHQFSDWYASAVGAITFTLIRMCLSDTQVQIFKSYMEKCNNLE